MGWVSPLVFLLLFGWLICALTLGLEDKKVAAPFLACIGGPIVNLLIAGIGTALTLFRPLGRSEKIGHCAALAVTTILFTMALYLALQPA
jgi:hypothetical protein